MTKKQQKAINPKEVIPTIQGIIATQLKIKPAEVKLDANLQKDLGAESLDALEIIMYIEEAFGIDIPDDEARKAETVGDIANYVTKRIKKS
jgi:acyl carrier protein